MDKDWMEDQNKDGVWYLTNWSSFDEIKEWAGKDGHRVGRYIYVLRHVESGWKVEKDLIYKKGKKQKYINPQNPKDVYRDIYIFRINKKKKCEIAGVHLKNLLMLKISDLK